MADFFAGYISGALGILIGSPLDILKVHLQSRSGGGGGGGSHSQLFPTPTSYLRGTAAPILGYGGLNALLFCSYNRILTFLYPASPSPSPSPSPSLGAIWAAGALSGVVSFVLDAPVEFIKVRAQTRVGVSSFEVMRGVLKREGLAGLYFGGGVTGLRDSVGYGFYFWAYEYTKRLLRDESELEDSSAKVLFAGGVAGCATWLSIYPLDVIKTRMQAQSEEDGMLTGRKKRVGAWECARGAYREGGVRVFFNGLGICMARAFLVNAVQWAVYEWVFQKLK